MLKKGKIQVVSRQPSSDASGQLVRLQLDSSLDLNWQLPVPSHRGKIISLIAPRSHVRLPRQIDPQN